MKNLIPYISLIFSFAALCIICVRNSPLDFDWYGALVGILSLLVTVILGWQIYSIINIGKIQKKMKKTKRELADSYDAKLAQMNEDLKEYTRGLNLIMSADLIKETDPTKALWAFINVIAHSYDEKFEDLHSMSLDQAIYVIEKHQDKIDKKGLFKNKENKEECIENILKSGDERTIQILNLLQLLEYKD